MLHRQLRRQQEHEARLDRELGAVVPEVHSQYLPKWLIPFFVGILPAPLAAALMDQFLLPQPLAAAAGLLEPRAPGTARAVQGQAEEEDRRREKEREKERQRAGAGGSASGRGSTGGWSVLRWMTAGSQGQGSSGVGRGGRQGWDLGSGRGGDGSGRHGEGDGGDDEEEEGD